MTATGPGSGRYDTPWKMPIVINGQSWTESYDPASRSLTVADPLGRASVAAHDSAGRLTNSSVAGQPDTAYSYDQLGRLATVTVGSGAAAAVTKYAYDIQPGRVTLTQPDGSTSTIDVDGAGRVVQRRLGDGSTQILTYDAAGRLVQLRPAGRPSWTIGYSGAGRPTAWLPPTVATDSGIETWTYDKDGGLASITGPGDRTIQFTRDAGGRPVTIDDSAGQTKASWSDAGLLTDITAPGGVDTRFSYIGSALAGLGWSGPVSTGTPPPNYTCVGICTAPNGATCTGYCSTGDPHLVTGDGRRVDFQAAGEFLAIASPDGGVVVQVRQVPPTGIRTVTFAAALAINVAGDHVGVYATEGTPLHLNGQLDMRLEFAERLAHGGILERHGTLFTIDWPTGSRMVIRREGNHLDYAFTPDQTVGPQLVGLLGSADGNPANDLTGRDGVLLDVQPSDPTYFYRLYHQFGESWRIADAESLFDYGPGESTATFADRSIPDRPASAGTLDPGQRDTAERICQAVGVRDEPLLDDCILDVGLTGDPSYAASAATVAAGSRPPAAIPNAVPITLGQTVSGLLTTPTQIDYYSIAAAGGQVVYLHALGECVDGLTWELDQPGGTQIDFERSCNDIGRRVLPDAGTYTIKVYSNGTATGGYGFALIGAQPVTTQPITIGQTVSGQVGAIGEWHEYTFAATAGQVVYLHALGNCVDGLQWELDQPGGTQIDFESSCNDIGRRVLPDAGTYTIRAFSTTTAIGPYSFALIGAPPVTTQPITIGQTVSGQVASIGEWHEYTFAATAGQVVYLHALGECVDGLQWELDEPGGTQIDFERSCNDIGRRVLPDAGTYTVRAFSTTTATGPYSFALIGAPPVTTQPITVGQTISSQIASIGEWREYTFAATAGDSMLLKALGPCVDGLLWALLAPDGTNVDFERTCVDIGQRNLTVAGNYTVRVYSDTTATGSYQFSLSRP